MRILCRQINRATQHHQPRIESGVRRAQPRGLANIALTASCSFLAGCMGANSPPKIAYDAASFDYQLPVTTAKVTTELVLQSCDNDKPIAAPKITVVPVANPNPHDDQRFRMHGAYLSSFTKNRQLSVDLYPNGSLKSVNGGVADRTGAIVTNVLKIATGLIPFFGAGEQPAPVTLSGKCNAKTMAALGEVKRLEAKIRQLRGDLPTASPAEAEKIKAAVDALAAEVARLRTGPGPLALSLEREIAFRKGYPADDPEFVAMRPALADFDDSAISNTQGGIIRWKTTELAKWLEVPAGEHDTAFFTVGYCVRRSREHYKPGMAGCTAGIAEDGEKSEKALEKELASRGIPGFVEKADCLKEQLRCAQTVVMRDPIDATLIFVSVSDNLKDAPPDKKLVTHDFQISQWGDITELPLTTGLGGNYTFAAGFNEFGRKTSFTWKSDARGEALTGAAAGIVDAAGGLRNALTTDLEAQQAEILELKTQKELNQLRFCREVIEAGGFNCPAS